MDIHNRDAFNYNEIDESNIVINNSMKNRLLQRYKNEVASIFLVPMAFTALEALNLTSSPSLAIKFRLAKLVAFPLSFIALHYRTDLYLKRAKYFDIHYPYPSRANQIV